MKAICRCAVILALLFVAVGCSSTDSIKGSKQNLADGWYECEKCKAMITSRDGKVEFQIRNQKSDTCVHKWKKSKGVDIDPLPDEIP